LQASYDLWEILKAGRNSEITKSVCDLGAVTPQRQKKIGPVQNDSENHYCDAGLRQLGEETEICGRKNCQRWLRWPARWL
jgi:hypothetical protein